MAPSGHGGFTAFSFRSVKTGDGEACGLGLAPFRSFARLKTGFRRLLLRAVPCRAVLSSTLFGSVAMHRGSGAVGQSHKCDAFRQPEHLC